MAHKELPEELQGCLKQIVDYFDLQEQPVRDRQIRLWKKLNYLWCGFTKTWWDETAHDWRIYDSSASEGGEDDYYDKQINVFRAYLETIIAALSATVPAVRCKPDDANNTSDVSTAKGGTKIAELVYDHIDAPLLWCKALFTYCTQGMVAAYNYTATDEAYGTVEVDEYSDVEETIDVPVCPNCKTPLDSSDLLDESIKLTIDELNEFDPSNPELGYLNTQGVLCPQCQVQVNPEFLKNKVIVSRLTGRTNQPKARQCIEVNGGLFVKVPNYARVQKDIPYLAYEYETHYTNVYKKYPNLRDRYPESDTKLTSASGNEAYERWGRLNPQYWGEYPQDTPTVRNWWLRPSAFECIADEDNRAELYKRFPHGCKVVFINELYADSCDEDLDDHWTLTYNPLSEYIHFDPLGLLLISFQEITTDLVSLTLQTIEHGIPQTFVDPTVLDFNAYRQSEAIPGGLYAAKSRGGKSVGEGFHTISTSTLSREVGPFQDWVQNTGQFVVGALPSLFGGSLPGSGETAAEYSMSRNQALQRLQTPWKMINYWWKNIFAKVIPAYIKNMLEDERLVKQEYNSFINITIKKAQLDGKIGSVELESSDQLPISWTQKKDTLMRLMELNNPQILQAIADPSNLEILRQAIGLEGFNIPGSSDREKQFEEIQALLKSEPIVMPDGNEFPSIMPDMDVDNHMIEGVVCREWLVGDAGRIAKVEVPNGYKNILLHMKMHQLMMAPPEMPQQEQEPSQEKLRPVEQ